MRISSAALSPRKQEGKAPEDRSAFFSLLTYFRETNAEGQRIRSRLSGAIQLAQSEQQDDPRPAFEEVRSLIRKEVGEARIRASSIDKLRNSDAEWYAWCARELAQLNNGWDDLDNLWQATEEQELAAELIARGKESIAVLDTVIFTCACQTIPNELNEYLKNYRIGKCLDFMATFGDQLPDEISTRSVLARLAPQSGIVSGLIDLSSGKVIKADQRWWRQAVSVALVLGIAALGFGLIAMAVHLGTWFQFSAADWTINTDQWAAFNGAYLLVLFGVLGHWIFDRIKQNRAGAEITPLAEWLIWVHINEVSITIRIAMVWLLILLGVAFKTFDLTKGVQPLTYFTAGYFMDSTFDALIGRFNTFISDKNQT